MVEPGKRTNKNRKVYKRTPGGKTKKHYIRRKSKKKTCTICGAPLKGKRPGRAYSRTICANCVQDLLKAKTRKTENSKIKIPARLQKFIGIQ